MPRAPTNTLGSMAAGVQISQHTFAYQILPFQLSPDLHFPTPSAPEQHPNQDNTRSRQATAVIEAVVIEAVLLQIT